MSHVGMLPPVEEDIVETLSLHIVADNVQILLLIKELVSSHHANVSLFNIKMFIHTAHEVHSVRNKRE